ncbi:hypothetical protein COCVIDRAFT_24175 [Bipolaris victoriae FI3]|uniref:VWFA domain-containing protein n=1 Tax=Bipolaris victoriae (strain FI3) TaxID=930091 RepID=W7EPA0_BIPV3|nr:hypothetical protein COCVIDRAFT_24175 [Bipolaris victoriae FI3]
MNYDPVTPRASPVPKAPPCNSKVELKAENSYREHIEPSDTDPYAFLKSFDTIFIDDSGSMSGRSWQETRKALENITPICTQDDGDGIDLYFLNHTASTKPINTIVTTDGEPTDDMEAHIVGAAKKPDDLEASAWQGGTQFQVGKEEHMRAAIKQLYDRLVKLSGDEKIVMPYLPKASSARYRAFPNTAPKGCDRSRTVSRTQLLRINPAALTFLTIFAQLSIIQAAPQHISTTWGIPIFNTLGVGTGLAISVFDDEANTHPVLYWIVYGFWSVSALLVVAFTTFSIKKSSRLRYFCTFVLVEFILLTMIAVSSIGDQGFVTKHLREWTPLATVAIAGALTVGFKRVA